jgi:hypothetical protein
MSKTKIAIGVAVGLFAVYVVAAPYIAVFQMKSAAENHDGEALSEYIEYPSVRQSLKDQMNAMFAKKIADAAEMKDSAFAAFVAAVAGKKGDEMGGGYVTPASITQVIAGEKPQPGVDTGGEGGSDTSNSGHKPPSDTSMSYQSFNKFVVKVKDEEGREGKFILRRRGITWKLMDIIIPLE